MARASVNIFGFTPPRSTTAPEKNRDPAGYGSWERPLEEQTLQVLVCNTFGQSFYSDAKSMITEAEAVFDKMIAKDSKFFAQALVYAREKGFMRTSPILGLVKLFAADRESAKKVFNRVIRTPNDLSDFTSILKSKRGGEGGSAIKKTAGKWLIEHLDEYRVVKYGAEKGDGGYSLKDMLQVYHPRAGTKGKPKKLPLFDYIMGRDEVDFKKLISDGKEVSVIEQFELLKRATTDEEKIQAIMLGRLPHEVATSFAGSSKAVWNAIAPNMPIFALLRNLATLERHGVLEDNKAFIQKMFSSKEVISKSMILPFRFMEADRHVNTAWVKDCLRDGLELSFDNLPTIDGKTAVMLDISGSMGDMVSTKSQVSRCSVGAIFGVSLMKKTNGNGRFILFDTQADEVSVSMRDSILTQASKIHPRGGTDHSVAMRKLGKDSVDNIVYITDEQQNSGSPLVDTIDRYRKSVNKGVKVFIVDLAAYRNALTPNDPNTWYMYGWSDSALQFIGRASSGFGNMTDEVKKIEL